MPAEVRRYQGEAFSRECGQRLMQQLIEDLGGLPDALVTTSYVLLQGVFDTLQARPADSRQLQLGTFGDNQLLDFLPLPVNAMAQQHGLIAATALELALAAIEENATNPACMPLAAPSSNASQRPENAPDRHPHSLGLPRLRRRPLAPAGQRGGTRGGTDGGAGVYQANFQRVWDLACANERLFAALGLHPVYLDEHRPEHLTQLRQWLERLRGDPRLCAVGEFGLDYYLEDLDKTRQQGLFEAQLQMACDFDLPALLHVRRSHAQVIATLKRYKPVRAGVIHAFAGSYEEAREYIKLGFRLGLGGAGTWPQALRLRKTLARLPLESVVLETDAPDMAPVMHPGMRNSPEHLPDIAGALAQVMGLDVEELAQASSRNACELFGW